MVVRQVKYLNNVVEQDYRAVKRITKPMFGLKSFQSAKNIPAGIELIHMIHKGQMMMMEGADKMPSAEQFYTLAE
ncbi:DDE domain-containing protein [Nitrosomonas cryotolerans]|uniref:DDE-type integrase/transposase/recombinase n=1 Tax=Nitrosomonas cryotolerans TaxID=44575 RepID=UPI0008E0C3FE|nr:DDE domain-containing protein [Nitrosomonas cryotolerans]